MRHNEHIWESEFGDDWTDRNLPQIDILARSKTFKRMIGNFSTIQSILEVGCNAGQNLQALAINEEYKLAGIDVNASALRLAIDKHPDFHFSIGSVLQIPYPDNHFDLVMTAGCLMHVTPDDIHDAVSEITRVASKFILIIEYPNLTEISVEWRGHEGLLWKRFYSEYFQMKCLDHGELDKKDGFDGCFWWLFEKPIVPYKVELVL